MAQQKQKPTEARVRESQHETSAFKKLRRGTQNAGIAALGAITLSATQVKADVTVSPLFDIAGGVTYEQPVVNINNIPLNIRNVPENPADVPFYAGGQGPIAQTSLHTSAFLNFGTLRLGMNTDFGVVTNSDSGVAYSPLRLSAGLGVDFGEQVADITSSPWGMSNIAERNYSNAPGTSQRGYGAALTYEQTEYKYVGGDWNTFMRPFVFAEMRYQTSTNWSLTVGAKFTEEGQEIITGWDRYDSLQTYQKFDAARYYIASPYLKIKWESCDPDQTGQLFGDAIFGFSKVLESQAYNGMSVSARGFPWFAGLELGARF